MRADQQSRFLDSSLVDTQLGQPRQGVDAMGPRSRGVRTERLQHDLLGLRPAPDAEQHRSVGDSTMRVEDPGPAAQALERQLVDEPVPLLGSAQVAAAIAGRQHGAERVPRDRWIAQMTPRDRSQGLVEPSEPFAHPSLRNEGEPAVGQRPHLEISVAVLEGDLEGAVGARQQLIDVGTRAHASTASSNQPCSTHGPTRSRSRRALPSHPCPAASFPSDAACSSASPIAARAASSTVSTSTKAPERRLPVPTRLVEAVIHEVDEAMRGRRSPSGLDQRIQLTRAPSTSPAHRSPAAVEVARPPPSPRTQSWTSETHHNHPVSLHGSPRPRRRPSSPDAAAPVTDPSSNSGGRTERGRSHVGTFLAADRRSTEDRRPARTWSTSPRLVEMNHKSDPPPNRRRRDHSLASADPAYRSSCP